MPVTPVLSPSTFRARLSRALTPAALASRRPCCPVPSRRPCCPVAPAVPSRRPCRRVAPAVPVPCRCSCCPIASPPAVPSRPVASPPFCPAASCRPSRPVPSRPVACAPCALPVRRAPAPPCPSVAPRAPCPSVALPLRPARPSRPVRPARPHLSRPDRYARERADVTAWKSRDAATCIALSSLLPESEETHFTQVRMASEFLTAIKARYATPTTVSLGRLFLRFLFPDLVSFERTADLITHLHSLVLG
ncbi:unnamed protein product [Closterium sp. NIES-54]